MKGTKYLACFLFLLTPALIHSQTSTLGDTISIFKLLPENSAVARKVARNSVSGGHDLILCYLVSDFVIYKFRGHDKKVHLVYKMKGRWYYFKRVDYEFNRKKLRRMIKRTARESNIYVDESDKIISYVQYLIFWNDKL
jgi:hypothetical protein